MTVTILFFVVAIAILNVITFFMVPADLFVLGVENFQAYQLVTFQFAHINYIHLLENLIGLLFIAALATELDMDLKEFALAYFTGVYIAVPLLLFIPDAVIAGNSTGIFAILAAALIKANDYVPIRYSLPGVFVFMVAASSAFNCYNCGFSLSGSDVFHLAGFISGAAVILGRAKERILW